jgi:hypothetical protein
VHVYLPEVSHPADNLIRAIVKDSTDTYNGTEDANFLDSGQAWLLKLLTYNLRCKFSSCKMYDAISIDLAEAVNPRSPLLHN